MPMPRIPPADDSELPEEARELLERASIDGRQFNIFRTFAHHPKLLKRWLVFATHILSKSSLSERDREVVILRTAWLNGSPYEWGQHYRIAQGAGLSREEIARVAEGADAPGLASRDRLLIRAVDELHADRRLSDDLWAELDEIYSREQMMDFVFTVGQYAMLALALNSFGVERDPGVPGFEETVGKAPAIGGARR